MNEIQVTIRGNVTSEPRQVRFDDGNIVTSFRVASNARRYDQQTREWVNAGTTFVNVNCRRGMAVNAASSLRKGQPVLVTGKLRERAWEKDGRSGRSLEIEADGLGHDLAWGTTAFSRVVRVETLTTNDRQAEEMAFRLSQDADAENASHLEAAHGPELDAELDDIDDLDDLDDLGELDEDGEDVDDLGSDQLQGRRVAVPA